MELFADPHETNRVVLGARISEMKKYNPEEESPYQFCRRMQDDLNTCCPDVVRAKQIIVTKLEPIHRERISQMDQVTRFGGSDVSLETFFDELAGLLVSKRERELAHQRMLFLVKTDFETVEEFANAIRFEGDFAFPTKACKGKEVAIMDAFVNGLDETTKFHIKVTPPTSLEDAVEIARRVEDLLPANIEFEGEELPVNAVDIQGICEFSIVSKTTLGRESKSNQCQVL